MYYVVNKADTEKIDAIFLEFQKAVTLEHKEDIMTIAERLEQKSKEAGIQIGKQEGKTQGIKNVALNMISENFHQKH